MTDLVDFLSDSYTAYMISHCGFWLFNALNCSYLIVFEWFVFQRLPKNYLSKLALLACFIQSLSCISSIHRYNINDPYGLYAHVGVVTGLLALVFMNMGFFYLHFKGQHILTGWMIMTILPIIDCVFSFVYWGQVEYFFYFKSYFGLSMVYQLVVIITANIHHKNGAIAISDSILSSETMSKVLVANLGLHIVAFAMQATGIPIFKYPGTGLAFMNFNILMLYAGRMDFMTDYSPVPSTATDV